MAWLAETNSGLFKTWSMLKLLRDNWDGPIVLKGIQSVEDAHLAMEHGMDGIVVSNHGLCPPPLFLLSSLTGDDDM